MKKAVIFSSLIYVLFLLSGCSRPSTHYINAEILEVDDQNISVKPIDNGTEVCAAKKILEAERIILNPKVVSADGLPELKCGDNIRVLYNQSSITENPLKINTVFAIYQLDEDGKIITPPEQSKDTETDTESGAESESELQNPPLKRTEAQQNFIRIYTHPTEFGGDRVYLTPDKAFQKEFMMQSVRQEKKQEPDSAFWSKHKKYGFGFSYDGIDYEIFSENFIVVRTASSSYAFESEKLCSMVEDYVKKEAGIVPFFSEAIENIEKAELVYRDDKSSEIAYYERIYSPEALGLLEKTLNNIPHNGDSSCPFYEFFLNLVTSDDSRMTLAMASDSCNSYFVNGRYFNYESSTGNQVFYTLFPHAPINQPYFRTPKEEPPKEKSEETSLAEMPNFTQEEIRRAMESVEKKFKEFSGADMLHLWYDEEKSDSFVKDYLKYGKGSDGSTKAGNVIVLLSDFVALPENGADMSLQLGSPYDDFRWVLVRENETAPWNTESWGY